MKYKYLILSFMFVCKQISAADYIDVVTKGVRAGTAVTKEVYNTFEGISKSIIGALAKRDFERAIRGGHAIYLQEDKQVRATVVPTIVPFAIDVTRAEIRSENGVTQTENATRSAKNLFNGKPDAKTLVRERKFMRNDFGRLQNPDPGARYVLEVWYRCLDDRGSEVGNTHHAQAHQMNNIRLSCLDIPSVYKGKFTQ